MNLRNTEAELSKYEPESDELLDRIFDEYGLVIAGWSSEYDHALRTAIERRKGRRYSFYWMLREVPNEHQKKLIGNSGIVTIERPSADDFFEELERALEGAKRQVRDRTR